MLADLSSITSAEVNYLTVAYDWISHAYIDAGKAAVADFTTFLHIFLPTAMVIFIIMMLLVFFPQIRHVNRQLYTKRRMLMYLPPEIIERVTGIQELIEIAVESKSVR